MRKSPLLVIPVVAALTALALAGCAPTTPADGAQGIQVVASTNVYGDLVTAIGGGLVSVTSIIDDPGKDPHEYEADARTELALSKADLVVRNGGGYDDFIDTLLAASDNADVTVIDAVELSGFDTKAPDFNEHVWYDYATVSKVVQGIEGRLEALDAPNAAIYAANAAALQKGIAMLDDRVAEVSAAHTGAPVAITEPVPLYLLEAMGLVNRTPAAFSEAVENDTDVPATVLRDTLRLFTDGDVDLLVYNPQTGGPQTDAVLAAAKDAGVTAVAAGELLPEGTDYLAWQGDLIDAIAGGLER